MTAQNQELAHEELNQGGVETATKLAKQTGVNEGMESLQDYPNLRDSKNEKLYKDKVDEIHKLEDQLMAKEKKRMENKDEKSMKEFDNFYKEIRGKQAKIGEELLKTVGITLKPGQRVDVYSHITGDMVNKGEKSISIILANGSSNYENSTRYSVDPTKKVFQISSKH